MAYRTGLGSQLGFATETTVGTAVTVTKFVEFNSESIVSDVQYLESEGLKTGVGFGRASRALPSRYGVKGDIEVEAADRGLGVLLRQATGTTATTPTQIATSGAYKMIYDPSDQVGDSLTVQVGRGRTNNAAAYPYTYRGVKIPAWEFSCSDSAIAKWKFTVDGWRASTATALAAASFVTGAAPFRFSDCNSNLVDFAGTAATLSSGVVQLSGGALVSIAKGVTIKCDTGMDTERFGLGNAGTKAEQLENAIGSVMIDLDMEHTTADGAGTSNSWYDAMESGAQISYELRFVHGNAGGGNAYELHFYFPACKVKTVTPQVSGPDIVKQKVTMQAYDPEISGIGPYQIVTVNAQSAL